MIETVDPYLAKVAAAVSDGVWHTTHVEACEIGPAVTYTTGLWRLIGAPELVVCALEEETAYALVDEIARAMKQGFRPKPGVRYDQFLEEAAVAFVRVETQFYEPVLEHAVWYYSHHLSPPQAFPAIQCVLPHRGSGRLPWEDGYPTHLDDMQPLLGHPG